MGLEGRYQVVQRRARCVGFAEAVRWEGRYQVVQRRARCVGFAEAVRWEGRYLVGELIVWALLRLWDGKDGTW